MTSQPLRAGVTVLDCDSGAETDLRALLSADAEIFVSRVSFLSTEGHRLESAEAHLAGAVSLLAPIQPDVLLWACTSSGLRLGVDPGSEIRYRLREWSGAALT